MKAKRWIPLALALILGLAAAKMTRDWMVNGRGGAGDGSTVMVVAAARDIGPGQKLGPMDVVTVKVAAEGAPSGYFAAPEHVFERVAVNGLVKGQHVLESTLAPSGAAAGVQALIPAGMRAITVQVDEFTGLGGLLVPGCKVDIIAVVRAEDDKTQVARTIVQNVEIRAVGKQVSAAAASASTDPAAAAAIPTNITLLVTPEQAEAIQLASVGGKPWMALRNASDAEPFDSVGTSMADLRGDSSKKPLDEPAPTKLTGGDPFADGKMDPFASSSSASRSRTVMFIRSGKVEEVKVNVPSTPSPAPRTTPAPPAQPPAEFSDIKEPTPN